MILLCQGLAMADEPQLATVMDPKPVSSDTLEGTQKTRQNFNQLKRSTRNIYKVTMRSGVSFKLQTALGYVSTIDLPENALKVFVGDQELFKVEVYEKQVLIKPATDEPDARTNLVIVTPSGRLTFDVSVGIPETADFVLDFRLPQDDETLVKNAFYEKVREKTMELEKQYRDKEKRLSENAEFLSEQKLKKKVAEGVLTVDLKNSKSNERIQVTLHSISRMGGKIYLRFSVENKSKTTYKPLRVMVGALVFEKKFFGKKEAGIIEIPSELELARVISADATEYGVLVFDYKPMGKRDKPVFRIWEDSETPQGARDIEIKGFDWVV